MQIKLLEVKDQAQFLSKTEERQIQQSKIRRAPLPVPKEEIITQQELDID